MTAISIYSTMLWRLKWKKNEKGKIIRLFHSTEVGGGVYAGGQSRDTIPLHNHVHNGQWLALG